MLPIVGEIIEGAEVELRIAGRVLQRRDNGVEIRLRGAARHRSDCEIDHIDARVSGTQHTRRGHAARIMRVEVNRQANFLLESLHQFLRGIRAA